MKLCTSCNTEKEEQFFYKDKSKKDNLTSNCKECKRKTASQPKPGASLYKNLSPEAVVRERIRKNKYRKENPKVVRECDRRLRVKRSKVTVECTNKEAIDFMKSKTHCVQCGSTNELTLDHIIPISWGFLSRHALDNFQVLCNTCNGTKSNNWSIDFQCDNSLSEVNLLVLC